MDPPFCLRHLGAHWRHLLSYTFHLLYCLTRVGGSVLPAFRGGRRYLGTDGICFAIWTEH